MGSLVPTGRETARNALGGGFLIRLSQAVLLFVLLLLTPCFAGKTVMVSGTWITNSTPQLVQAEIGGKYETVVLPKFDFEAAVDGAEMQNRIRTGIVKQGALFHLYQDGLGSPIRKGGMLFASDVFLKELKTTFSATLREFGYKFKLGDKPAYEDGGYLVKVQSGTILTDKGSGKPDKIKGSFGSVQSAHITTAGDFLPDTVLPPSVRKIQKELEKRIREIKNRPFKAEVLMVDVVRWAGGKMGEISKEGHINGSMAEGRTIECLITPPVEKDWLTPARVKSLKGQACEYILQRDSMGREARQGNAYRLADLYLTDLAQTWDEWLTSEKLSPASKTTSPDFATGPVVIKVIPVNGIWKELKAPVLGLVSTKVSPAGPGGEELIRLAPPDNQIDDFRALAATLNPLIAGKPLSLSMMMCGDGKPYLELGQKRVSRVYFPETKTTLKILMQEHSKPPKH